MIELLILYKANFIEFRKPLFQPQFRDSISAIYVGAENHDN